MKGAGRMREMMRDEVPAIGSAARLSAPEAVAISSTIATRILAIRSRTYAAAAPLDVAMTETIDAPIA